MINNVQEKNVNHTEVIDSRKRKMINRLKESSIILFGGGATAREFLKKYGKRLNIKLIMSNNVNEKTINLNDKMSINVEKYNKSLIQKNDIVIVCRKEGVGNWYKEAVSLLVKDGLVFGKDYLSASFVSSVLDGRKIISIVGYCQLSIISKIFNRSTDISSNYHSRYFFITNDAKPSSVYFNESIVYTQYCDILVYVPHFAQSNFKTSIDYQSIIASDTIIYRYPQLSFRGLHPYKDKDLRKRSFMERMNVKWPARPFQYAEPNLDELVEQGLNNDEILKIVLDDNYISNDIIQKNYKLALKSTFIISKENEHIFFQMVHDRDEALSKKRINKDRESIHLDDDEYISEFASIIYNKTTNCFMIQKNRFSVSPVSD